MNSHKIIRALHYTALRNSTGVMTHETRIKFAFISITPICKLRLSIEMGFNQYRIINVNQEDVNTYLY